MAPKQSCPLSPKSKQLGKVKAVLLDLKRADRAANAGRATGSNTAQNLAGDSMFGAGLLGAER